MLKARISGQVHWTVLPVVGQVPALEGVAETKVTLGWSVSVTTGLVDFELDPLCRLTL